MTDLVQKFREALAKITPWPWYRGKGKTVVYSYTTPTTQGIVIASLFRSEEDTQFVADAPQWLSEAAEEIERQTKIIYIAKRWAHAKQMVIAEANLGNTAWKTWDLLRGELEEELENRIADYKETL